MVFDSGEREQSFTFTAEPDTVDDDGESVKLGFGGTLPDGVSEGSPDEAVVSITDDDVPSVTVSFGQPSYTVGEGNSVMVKVILSADPERTVTIPLLSSTRAAQVRPTTRVCPKTWFSTAEIPRRPSTSRPSRTRLTTTARA